MLTLTLTFVYIFDKTLSNITVWQSSREWEYFNISDAANITIYNNPSAYYDESFWFIRDQHVRELQLNTMTWFSYPSISSGYKIIGSSGRNGAILYLDNYSTNNITLYNLETNVFTSYVASIPGYAGIVKSYCLMYCEGQDILYVNGGAYNVINNKNSVASTKVLNLTSSKWFASNTVPNMDIIRSRHTCQCINDVLYSIAGCRWETDSGSNIRNSIETINTTNIMLSLPVANSWSTIGNLHTRRFELTSTVMFNRYIVVIGGLQNEGTRYISNKVDIIDTETNSITSAPDLLFPVSQAAVLFYNSDLYVFGGKINQQPRIYAAFYQKFYDPTPAPTNDPTTASPTNDPTPYPTLNPTASPTKCLDFYPYYNSSDGNDVIHNNFIQNDEKHLMYKNQSFINNTNATIQTYIEDMYDAKVICDDINADVCFIGCYNSGDCAKINIEPVANAKLNEIKLICAARKACDEANIFINDITPIDRYIVSIQCASTFACKEAIIVINTSKAITVSIECSELKSCENMLLDLIHTQNNIETMSVNISCFDDYSCDNMLINTDNAKNIFISLNAYRYSEDIKINYRFWRNINVQCGSDNDHRYIRYDTTPNALPEVSEILQLARNEYHTTKRLPCEDIHIICSGNNTDFYQECKYEYELRDDFSLIDILNNEYRPNCYWLDIGELYQASCEGTCDDKMVYTQYNVTFDLNLEFIDNSDDDTYDNYNGNATKSYTKCKQYFGSINDTSDSLNSIDAVFYSVLNVIANIPQSILHDVVIPSNTILRDNLSKIECVNEKVNIIRITTDVGVEADHSNERDIDTLFDENSKFINESTLLLSKLFGITIKNVNEKTFDVTKGISKLIVVWIVLGALCIICVIILMVLRAKKRRNDKLEAMTIYMTNPMVLPVAIGFYDHEPKSPQIDGYLCDLDQGIRWDIQNIIDLFGKKFNYNIFPDYSNDNINTYKAHWKKKELMKFLKQKADDLENNIKNNNQVGYDGLVVVVSAHGIEHHILTSDYKKIKKTTIHRIFSVNGESRKLPRVFLFDVCSGNKQKENETRSALEERKEEELKIIEENKKIAKMKKHKTKQAKEVKSNEENKTIKKKRRNKSKQTAIKSGINNELKKNVSVKEITHEQKDNAIWARDEVNPDFRLCLIHASNEGYQSKLNTQSGSYVVTQFIERINSNIDEDNNKKFLFQICNDIQSELHRIGKQLPEYKFNNGTEYVKFVRNESSRQHDDVFEGKSTYNSDTNGENITSIELQSK
eukprot:37537_1